MGALRSVMTGGSPRRPGLLVFGLLMMVIAGLFAMHVLSMSGPMGHTYPTLTIETEHIAANAGPDEAMSAPVADQMAGSNTSDAGSVLAQSCAYCRMKR